MKSYLELVPISAKVHRKQNKMSIFCIVLAVFLVTTIFGMTDMFIRSQILQAQQEYGRWHIAITEVGGEEISALSEYADNKNISRYADLNFHGDMGYMLSDKDVIICGSDTGWTEMFVDFISEGVFPQNEKEALVSENARAMLGLQIGDSVSIDTPDGMTLQYTVSGFFNNAARNMSEDMYGIFVTIDAFCEIISDVEADILEGNDILEEQRISKEYSISEGSRSAEELYLLLFIEFADNANIQAAIDGIRQSFGLSDGQIHENTRLLGLLGQSRDSFMLQIYYAAAILFVLVLSAGVMMIASSLNSNVAQRTEFFGLMRCVGATPRQVMRLVYKEAIRWCRFAIPMGVVSGIVLISVLCAVLRYLSPQYFGAMLVFSVSVPSIMAGIIEGFLTVILASRTPAKKAAKVSPLVAASGSAAGLQPVRKAAGTKLLKVDTALGIHHVRSSRKNLILMTGSFAFSIILFLSFSVTVTLMQRSLTALKPWTPDLSIESPDGTCSIGREFLELLQENGCVRAAYGRMLVRDVPAVADHVENRIDLLSYEQKQFDWAKDYLQEGFMQEGLIQKGSFQKDSFQESCLETVQSVEGTGLIIYEPQCSIKVGDVVSLNIGGRSEEIKIVGMLSDSPFHHNEGAEVIICSEDTFRQITGQSDYAVIDVQLIRNAADEDINAIHQMFGTDFDFSDKRLGNNNVRGSYYCFRLFIYGFLVVIALITIFNVVNSIAMSVAARTKLYGAFRAIGLSARQLSKMVIAEAAVYTITGSIAGTALGLICNRLLFDMLINYRWGDTWSIPWNALGVILLIVILSVALAVYGPIQKIRSMSVVDTISAQ